MIRTVSAFTSWPLLALVKKLSALLFSSQLMLLNIAKKIHQILIHAASPSIFISALVSTVTTYSDTSTTMVKRHVEIVAESIHDPIFRVDNMIGVGFLNSKEKLVIIDNPAVVHPTSIFTFCSSINHLLVDLRALDAILLFEFSLPLPNTFHSSSVVLPLTLQHRSLPHFSLSILFILL